MQCSGLPEYNRQQPPEKRLDSKNSTQVVSSWCCQSAHPPHWQVSRDALERDEERRAAFQYLIGQNYTPDMLVFVDESACNRHTSKRRQAWAPSGTRARRHDYFVRGTRYLVLDFHWP